MSLGAPHDFDCDCWRCISRRKQFTDHQLTDELDYRCANMNDRVGYRGQKYEVRFTDENGNDRVFGWQNQPAGGLADAAAMHPGWGNVRVIEVNQKQNASG